MSSLFLCLAFISCSYSISSTSTFLCLFYLLSFGSAAHCLQYAPVSGRSWGRDALAVVFGSDFAPRRSPLLHIKPAALGALSSSHDRTCQLGGRVDRLASNIQTRGLSPGDFLSLPPSVFARLPFLSILIQHTLAEPIDLSESKQAKRAAAAQRDHDCLRQSFFTVLPDSTATIRPKLCHSESATLS